jgi:protocatechuate 3,4-dioxygenase beta subunit
MALSTDFEKWKPNDIEEGPPIPQILDQYLPWGGHWPWYKEGGGGENETAGTLSGVVTDEVGVLAGVTVSIGSGNSVTTDSSGQYQFTNIPVGSYTITFNKSGYDKKEITMQINSGNNPLNVQMVAVIQPGTLSGTVTDSSDGKAISGVSVQLSGSGGSATATTDSTGSYAFTNITPGNYTITFSKSGYTTVTK